MPITKYNDQEVDGILSKRKFMSETQLARFIGVSVKTLQKKRSLGEKPPYYKLGGAVRYDLYEVFEWIDGCKVPGKLT